MYLPKWHIHVDAKETTAEFEKFAIETLGFWRQDFMHVAGEKSYEPDLHLTYRPADSVEFKDVFGRLREFVESHPGTMTGYIEGECIPYDLDIAEKPFNQEIPLPLKLSLGQLPQGDFREDEIHISLLRDKSDPRLLDALKNMGLFVGYLPKKDGVAAIFTVQGSRVWIEQLLPALTFYLQRAGGGVRCSIKEERIAEWWVSDSSITMPPVVHSVTWL